MAEPLQNIQRFVVLMKNVRKIKIFILPIFIFISTMTAWAQTFTVIHTFTNNPDGGMCQAGLTLNQGTLFGGTDWGGSSGAGSIFRMGLDGSNYFLIKSFSPLTDRDGLSTNTDGAHPTAALIVCSNTIYGTTSAGGSGGNGLIFKMGTNGISFTVLKDFTNDANGVAVQGSAPILVSISNSNLLYGTCSHGLFRINTDGTGFTNFGPNGNYLLNGDTFYGAGSGTIFTMNTNAMDFSVIRTFTNPPDGNGPEAPPVLCSNTLYGTTSAGGSNNWGTIFKVNTDGSAYAEMKSFSFFVDGASPQSSLVLIGNILYGTAYQGGPPGYGTLYKIGLDGGNFAVIKSFSGNDGLFPVGNLIICSNTLYGATSSGGEYNAGTIYSLDPNPINATIWCSNSICVVGWNAVVKHVYQLQSTTNLSSSWQNVGDTITATNGIVSTPVTQMGATENFYRVNLVQ